MRKHCVIKIQVLEMQYFQIPLCFTMHPVPAAVNIKTQQHLTVGLDVR